VLLVAVTVLGFAAAPEREGLPKWVPSNPPTSGGWPVGTFGCDSNPWEQYDYPEAADPHGTIHAKSPAAVSGRAYRLEVRHCGLDWITDFDGSFWAVVPSDSGVLSNLAVNEGVGTIRLTGPDQAAFTEWRHDRNRGRLHTAVPDYEWEWGDRVTLHRLEGPIVIAPCA
jgi:hypothetical protein